MDNQVYFNDIPRELRLYITNLLSIRTIYYLQLVSSIFKNDTIDRLCNVNITKIEWNYICDSWCGEPLSFKSDIDLNVNIISTSLFYMDKAEVYTVIKDKTGYMYISQHANKQDTKYNITNISVRLNSIEYARSLLKLVYREDLEIDLYTYQEILSRRTSCINHFNQKGLNYVTSKSKQLFYDRFTPSTSIFLKNGLSLEDVLLSRIKRITHEDMFCLSNDSSYNSPLMISHACDIFLNIVLSFNQFNFHIDLHEERSNMGYQGDISLYSTILATLYWGIGFSDNDIPKNEN